MATQKQIVNRLKRARGQLDGLIEQLESGDASCRDVLTQFAALSSAINRASYLTVATVMSQCIVDDDSTVEDAAAAAVASAPTKSMQFVKSEHITLEELEKLFLSFA